MTTESPSRLCAACGGPLDRRAVTACVDRPGALTLAAIYDDLIFDGKLSWLDDLPATCPACHVDADQPHHLACEFDQCAVHRGPRDECRCDAAWLAEAARVPWRERIRWPQLRRPRWRRRRFRPGEDIVRTTQHTRAGRMEIT